VIFGELPAAEAEGAILAHATRAGALLLKKGRVLSAADVAALTDAGITRIVTARLGDDDVPEDQAAAALAKAVCGPGLTQMAAFTGRANLYAAQPGIVVADPARIAAVNGVDEAVTIATLNPFDPVTPRQMVATIKIIPFAVPRAKLDQAIAVAQTGGPLITVRPFQNRPIALISTRLPGMKESLLDKNRTALQGRLDLWGGHIVAEERTDHRTDALAPALDSVKDSAAELIFVFGASAIVDRRDVIPAAIGQAGGQVLHFGMPVDPGNLLLLAEMNGRPVIGLPGCARSPKLNGFDFVLQRLLAGLRVTGLDLAAMGAGGLLKEIETRPQPRDKAAAGAGDEAPRAPRIAAIILAAGRSSRMGPDNKLLTPMEGVPLVRRVAEQALASDAETTILVTGHMHEQVAACVAGLDLDLVHNPDAMQGLSTSLRAGLDQVPDDCDGALILLGDMPDVTAGHLDRLIAAFNPVEGRAIIVPTVNGKRGNPVLFARRYFPAMKDTAGDTGARHVIGQNPDDVAEVAMSDPGTLIDLDTPEAWAAYRAGKPPHG